jgi:hypothetical protein
MIHCWLPIPIATVGPKEFQLRQVSLCIWKHNNAVCNNIVHKLPEFTHGQYIIGIAHGPVQDENTNIMPTHAKTVKKLWLP